jgi:hypothetical protein
MREILPHWHFSPNAPVKDVDTKKMTSGDRAVAEACRRVMEVMPGDSFHQGAKAQLSHMVKTRDGGETIRIIKTLAVKGRF